jgi:hypothetical protein
MKIMRGKQMNGLTIGQVAEAASVHIETLRYYEHRGLLRRPARSSANYRLYREDAVRLYGGVFMMVASSVWNVWPHRHEQEPSCPACQQAQTKL